jgi:hypothetical protein
VLEIRMLRRMFEAERYEVTGCWRKSHNEKLRNLYSSPGIIRELPLRLIEIYRAWTNARCVQNFD